MFWQHPLTPYVTLTGIPHFASLIPAGLQHMLNMLCNTWRTLMV